MMAGSLTIEQMEFLAAKGCSAEEMIAFAKMGGKRSKGAERTARWRAKKNENVTETVTRDVTCDASHSPNEIYSNPVSSDEETRPPAKVSKLVAKRPDGVSEQTWADFQDLRKRKRAPLTQTALDGIRSEADKAGWSMEAALAKCLARGWQGFEADWVQPDTGKPPGAAGSMSQSILGKQHVGSNV